MEFLNTQQVATIFNSSMPPPTSSNGPLELKIPQSYVSIAKSLSYEFRVVEFVDENNVIKKVGLQYSVHEHDNYGVRQLRQVWKDVERVRLPFTG